MKTSIALVLTLVAGLAVAQSRPRSISPGGGSSEASTLAASATGTDLTLTPGPLKVGGAGMSTDGGFTLTGAASNITLSGASAFINVSNAGGEYRITSKPVLFGGSTTTILRGLATDTGGADVAVEVVNDEQLTTANDISYQVRNGEAGVGPITFQIGRFLTFSALAPTTPTACSSPTITHGNTTSFQADVGTTCAGVSTFSFVVAATENGMRCTGDNITASSTRILAQSAGWTGTTVTMTNYSRTLGTAADFADNADLVINCVGR